MSCDNGLVLARAAAGLSDNTIRSDVLHLEQLRAWFGGPLWDMQPADADAYFGTVLRDAAKGTRLARSQALRTYFLFVEIRHKAEIHQMTGRVAECPVDEMNRPRGAGRAALRIPPSAVQVGVLFAGWRAELATCRKFAPAARSYAASRLMADVGLRVNGRGRQAGRPARGGGVLPALRAGRPAGHARRRDGQRALILIQPLQPGEIDQATSAAVTPAARLAVALAAVHAARPKTIRELHLGDVDLGNRRLVITGRARPLDDLTATLLLAWLQHRGHRWPGTANPHLIINQQTA